MTFILWYKTEDTDFRRIYREVVGEEIEKYPRETIDLDRFYVGTPNFTLNKQNRFKEKCGIFGVPLDVEVTENTPETLEDLFNVQLLKLEQEQQRLEELEYEKKLAAKVNEE
jgi:hypothetical protein